MSFLLLAWVWFALLFLGLEVTAVTIDLRSFPFCNVSF
jgi:uncharacterized membrane protein